MAKLGERLRGTYETARTQFRGYESQLRGALDGAAEKIRSALALVTRDELKVISQKVEELSKRLEKYVRKTTA